jgi:hypothetical protein
MQLRTHQNQHENINMDALYIDGGRSQTSTASELAACITERAMLCLLALQLGSQPAVSPSNPHCSWLSVNTNHTRHTSCMNMNVCMCLCMKTMDMDRVASRDGACTMLQLEGLQACHALQAWRSMHTYAMNMNSYTHGGDQVATPLSTLNQICSLQRYKHCRAANACLEQKPCHQP